MRRKTSDPAPTTGSLPRPVVSIRNDTIKHHLEDMAKHYNYWLYGFVNRHGMPFGKCMPLPKGRNPGREQQCFFNAFCMTISSPSLTYVEGFARLVLAKDLDCIEHHAWVADERGRVFDPTWTGKLKGAEYFGIPLQSSYVEQTLFLVDPTCQSILEKQADDKLLIQQCNPRKWKRTMKMSAP